MRRLIVPTLLSLALFGCQKEEPIFESIFDVPPGFVVESAADPAEVGSLVQITFNAKGMPVVSKEKDHPTLLLDSDGDGVFETQKVVSDQVNNCQGLWYDGPTLYCIGDDLEGQAGMHALTDTDGDDVADEMETIVLFAGPMGEHGPHDMRRGIDGTPTVLLGNHTFVPEDQIDPTSPLQNYQEAQLLERYWDARGHAVNRMAPGGALFRVDREKKMFSLVLGGFRNPYNHAYNWEGEMFTFDSDMEWDINLPWYREVRSVHGIPGGDYGWRSGSGKFPAYYIDSLPPVDDLGRGSPVGVEFYQHYAYPAEVPRRLSAGRLVTRARRVLELRERRALRTRWTGDAVRLRLRRAAERDRSSKSDPTVLVYFTMGGRDTQGGFYRVNVQAVTSRQTGTRCRKKGVMAAVRQPQPLSAWGHQPLLEKQASGDGRRLGDGAPSRRAATRTPSGATASALCYLLQRFTPQARTPSCSESDARRRGLPCPRCRQPTSWACTDRDRAKALAVRGRSKTRIRWCNAGAPLRRSYAWGSRRIEEPSFAPVEDSLRPALHDEDRFVRWAGRIALESIRQATIPGRIKADRRVKSLTAAPEGLLALTRTFCPRRSSVEPVFENTYLLAQAVRPLRRWTSYG